MYSEISANKRKTVFIMLGFFVFISIFAYVLSIAVIGDLYFTFFVLIFAIGYAIWGYYGSSKVALAVNGAREITEADDPRLYRIVENLAITNGMPMPKVYIMDDPAMNAFATGRDPQHASVAATTGLMQVLDDAELEGVMAHELGHVKNYDIRVSMIAFALVTVVALISDIALRSMIWGGNRRENGNAYMAIIGLVLVIIAPIVATMLQLAISRKREYLADATGALTTRYPEALASALEKISQHGSIMRKQSSATAHFFFANPLKPGSMAKWFSTHPPVEERIEKLRSMGTKL